MKNKKGAKQQKFIQQVEKQVKSGGFHPMSTADLAAKKAEKERKLKEQQELGLLGKPIAVQKVEKGIFKTISFKIIFYNSKLLFF